MKAKKLNLEIVYPYLLTIGGAIGLIASFILTYDTAAIASNPHYLPSCNINPILSCGSVINAGGDKIFGLPYPYYGIAAFTALLSTGVAMLASAKFKRWYWILFQLFITGGTVGAYLLLVKSIYVIHALCPFCLSVDVVMTIILWYTTIYNIDNGIFGIKNYKIGKIYKWIRMHHLDLLVLWFILVIAFILNHFWYYYGRYF